MKGNEMKRRLFVTIAFLAVAMLPALADTANVEVVVLDDATGLPLEGVRVTGYFTVDIGWRAWTESSVPNKAEALTDKRGLCKVSGKTNCGKVGCWIENPPNGYYCPPRGWGHTYTNKNFFGVWQPDNLVATIRLQRVEHPIPLFVKRVKLRDYEHGIGGFDGTNSFLRFDLMKGDWLPPYGKGEVADMRINSKLKITDRERKFRYATKRVEDVLFYDLANNIMFGNDDDFVQPFNADRTAGIKVRTAEDENFANVINRVRGMRKKIARNGNWNCEYFSDSEPDRCYTFRIRTRRNDKGELVEAYYGKIYGDFEFEGDDKKGLIGVKFLYYLNPKSLDRNLEWDMKTNLCPNPGGLSMPQP